MSTPPDPLWPTTTSLERKYGFRPSIGWGIGAGWIPVIDRMLADFVSLGWTPEKVEILQIKEKFGGLRVYVAARGEAGQPGGKELLDAITKRIHAAEGEAAKTCAWCEGEGSLRGGRWLRVLCAECDARYLAGERR
jgi:hypothetical protein